MQPNTEQLAGILTDGVQFSGVFRPEITGKIHPARQIDDPDAPQTFPLQGRIQHRRQILFVNDVPVHRRQAPDFGLEGRESRCLQQLVLHIGPDLQTRIALVLPQDDIRMETADTKRTAHSTQHVFLYGNF